LIEDLLSEESQNLLWNNLETDPSDFVLKHAPSHLPLSDIADQIKGRKKYQKKLPGILEHRGFLFPSSKAGEQSSSELTAKYKSSLHRGKRAVDLTGGLGVDAYYLSKVFETVDIVEPDLRLCEFAQHNFQVLGADNVEVINCDAETYLEQCNLDLDLIYLDPDRRNASGRVFTISDCSPDAGMLLPHIERCTKNWMVKLSPMIDISLALNTLPGATYTGLISVDNDLKEVIVGSFADQSKMLFDCVDFIKERIFTCEFDHSGTQELFADPMVFLYEPSVSIMKLGRYGALEKKFQVKKLASNSNLYTADNLANDFPGRAYKIIDHVAPQRRKVAEYLKGQRVRIVSRNFPMTAEEIIKKWKILQGNDLAVFFTKLQNGNYVALIAEEIEIARTRKESK